MTRFEDITKSDCQYGWRVSHILQAAPCGSLSPSKAVSRLKRVSASSKLEPMQSGVEARASGGCSAFHSLIKTVVKYRSLGTSKNKTN